MPNGKNGKNKKLTLTLFWISIVLLLAVVGLAIWGLVMAGRRESFVPSSGIIPPPPKRKRVRFAQEEKIL